MFSFLSVSLLIIYSTGAGNGFLGSEIFEIIVLIGAFPAYLKNTATHIIIIMNNIAATIVIISIIYKREKKMFILFYFFNHSKKTYIYSVWSTISPKNNV